MNKDIRLNWNKKKSTLFRRWLNKNLKSIPCYASISRCFESPWCTRSVAPSRPETQKLLLHPRIEHVLAASLRLSLCLLFGPLFKLQLSMQVHYLRTLPVARCLFNFFSVSLYVFSFLPSFRYKLFVAKTRKHVTALMPKSPIYLASMPPPPCRLSPAPPFPLFRKILHFQARRLFIISCR